MFEGNRYITRGIKREIPIETQLILWGLIDELKVNGDNVPLDYLQIFELEPLLQQGGVWTVQRVVHRQEVPPYKSTIQLVLKKAVKAKIFVIAGVGDDGQTPVATMMLAEEY